jgi:hypothetical protein
MFERAAASSASETPWGQSWAEVVSALRPTAAENARLGAIVARVADALRTAVPPVPVARVVAGGPFGKGTHARGSDAITTLLPMYAVFEDAFEPADYFEHHLRPLFDAISATNDSPFVNVEDRGLAVHFVSDGIQCRLYAAGLLYGGPKDLLLLREEETPAKQRANGSASGGIALDPRGVHAETSAALLRLDLIRAQPPLYKDMVRIARKWVSSCDILLSTCVPGDYLLELLMMEAFHGAAAAAAPSPDLFTAIFRRFLALVSSESGTGSEVLAASDMPKSFLCWTTYYSRGTIDHCIAKGHLVIDNRDNDACSLVIVDPAVPYIDVARTVTDWSELRALARGSLAHFQNTEMIQVLDGRLKTLSATMERTVALLQNKIENLEMIERAPRRWSSTIQFRESHLTSDAWVVIVEMELRCLLWKVHARRPRGETSGYSQDVDLSLQVVGTLPRQLDVDVNYRGQESRLKFDDSTDHVLIARRSEVVRNRDYSLQITVIS